MLVLLESIILQTGEVALAEGEEGTDPFLEE